MSIEKIINEEFNSLKLELALDLENKIKELDFRIENIKEKLGMNDINHILDKGEL